MGNGRDWGRCGQPGVTERPPKTPPEEDEDEDEAEEPHIPDAGELEVLREEFRSRMYQRFLDGEDRDFDYRWGHRGGDMGTLGGGGSGGWGRWGGGRQWGTWGHWGPGGAVGGMERIWGHWSDGGQWGTWRGYGDIGVMGDSGGRGGDMGTLGS